MSPLRKTFATKLLIGGWVLSLLLILGVSSFLFISRAQQAQGAALSNADNKAHVLRQLLQKVTLPEEQFVAESLAKQEALIQAVNSPTPTQSVTALFSRGSFVRRPGEDLAIFDNKGSLLYITNVNLTPSSPSNLLSIKSALSSNEAYGLETWDKKSNGVVSGGKNTSYDIAVPIKSQNQIVGAVLYMAPISAQFSRFSGVVEYPAIFISVTDLSTTQTSDGNNLNPTKTDPQVVQALQSSTTSDSIQITYSGIYKNNTTQLAVTFVPIAAAGSTAVAGYFGVAVPVSDFQGDIRTDELSILAISLTALLVVGFIVLIFVYKFVRKPIATLEHAVNRIAEGDYQSEVPITSQDELGRLAKNVNLMKTQISEHVTEIQEARASLNDAVNRLQEISKTLTTTDEGVQALEIAILATAAGIAGPYSTASILIRKEKEFINNNPHTAVQLYQFLENPQLIEAVINGEILNIQDEKNSIYNLIIPMFYQGGVYGALVIQSPSRDSLGEGDEGALITLANNAAVALENTRLFEQEKQTVQRLLELNDLKSNFLNTIQHELRTPLMIILHMSELIFKGWDKLDDATKQDTSQDINIAAQKLGAIVENMLIFSLVNSQAVKVSPKELNLRKEIDAVVKQQSGLYKNLLPVELNIEVDEKLTIWADPTRIKQIFLALLDNAIKFTPPGKRVDIKAKNISDGKLIIEFSDQGIGIAKDALPHVFEQFYQEDNSAIRTYGGMGMGLTLVKSLAVAHGATVEINSTKGKGTSVLLGWPSKTEPKTS